MDFPVGKGQFDETNGVRPTEYDESGIPRGGPANYPGMHIGQAGDADSYEGNFDAATGEPLAHMRQRQDGILGPALMFVDTDLSTATWRGSVLVLVPRSYPPPTVVLNDGSTASTPFTSVLLDVYKQTAFYRIDISVRLEVSGEKRVEYRVNNTGPTYAFYVPGQTTPWRFAFWSCNGWSLSVSDKEKAALGGDNVVWDDLLSKHERVPFHVQVCGGDQLYSDKIWQSPVWKPWLKIKDKYVRRDSPFTHEMAAIADDFYFTHYAKCFFLGRFGDSMTTIPISTIIDDHDVWDGIGSYPDYLQFSQVFVQLKEYAFKYWRLYQAHTNQQLARQHGYFGKNGYSWLKQFGPYTAALGPDTRYERCLNRIIEPQTYDMIFDRLSRLPSSVRHVVVFLGVPIVYPRLTYIEKALSGIKSIGLTKLSFIAKQRAIVNIWGEPELSDDMNDHWTSEVHLDERKEFVLRLQEVARRQNIRVTFVGGDVHCCGAGRFASSNPAIPPERDFRFMPQIVSSAIMNIPPPNLVIRAVHTSAKTYDLDKHTDESMYKLFEKDVNGKSPPNNNTKLLARRNFSSYVEDLESGGLIVNIHVQNESNHGTKPYPVNVPALKAGNVV
ncbi:hypothetical protein LPJ77_004827 [Coemansia sp. RSA 2523]|nr:hypothetical protein LPJ58_000476 [Coemansia sp. RSA 1591]KAJ1767417.1 hypothetical protein LPJ69_000489 [Coemansia sp. RSA 1752]KAJ1772981.1 hypothetical protein LPJ54_004573 [Coemansia sp. RSA 1824]KAJ1788697.1 hypothetical protein LPJ62_002751 [Coemansia sp. RSA 2167]KAJ1794719.1 hypothetical protein LPJ67_000544 [Coemansia sp. RSA 1938]KAJ1804321.1 hypothetical protein LPJ77_004827 [Coemansia sp. RSA 2523]KAJ2142672.1 hypothetical protein IW142_004170 [Coemansia sp. RSA 564]KAJ2155218